MGEPKTEFQQTAEIEALDLSLQDMLDSVEDEVVIIDSAYRVVFANLAIRSGFQKGSESLIGRPLLLYQLTVYKDGAFS